MENTTDAGGWRYQIVRFADRRELEINGLHHLQNLSAEGWDVCGFANDNEDSEYLTLLRQPI